MYAAADDKLQERREMLAPILPLVLAERIQSLFPLFAEYLAASPDDFIALLYSSSKSVASQFQGSSDDHLWRAAYAHRWQEFFAYLGTQKATRSWKAAYAETLAGEVPLLMEVFEREKMPGFTMAAMSAWITVAPATPSRGPGFTARYISASKVPPEFIPLNEAHRIRCCPASVREHLQPGLGVAEPGGAVSEAAYPYRALEGTGGLVVGQGVEVQWKMQMGSPFGWWFGRLESLDIGEDPQDAMAVISFDQFPKVTRWHTLRLRFGDGAIRNCPFGGYTGGLRGVSPAEEAHWMRYFPKRPLPA